MANLENFRKNTDFAQNLTRKISNFWKIDFLVKILIFPGFSKSFIRQIQWKYSFSYNRVLCTGSYAQNFEILKLCFSQRKKLREGNYLKNLTCFSKVFMVCFLIQKFRKKVCKHREIVLHTKHRTLRANKFSSTFFFKISSPQCTESYDTKRTDSISTNHHVIDKSLEYPPFATFWSSRATSNHCVRTLFSVFPSAIVLLLASGLLNPHDLLDARGWWSYEWFLKRRIFFSSES